MSTSNFHNHSGTYGIPQFPFAAEFSQMYSSTSPSSGSSSLGFASPQQASTPQITPENHWSQTSQNRVVYGSPAIPYVSELSGWDGSTPSSSSTSSSGLATPPQGPTAHLAPLVAHTTAEQHETRYSPEVIEECESLARFIADGGALQQVDPIVYEDSQVSAAYRHPQHVGSSRTGSAAHNVPPRFDVAQDQRQMGMPFPLPIRTPYPPGAPRYSYRNDNVTNAYHGNPRHPSFPSTESGDVQHVALSRTGSAPYNLDVVPHLEFAHEKRTMGMPLAPPICAPHPPAVAYYSDPNSNGGSTFRGPQQARSFGSIIPVCSQTIAGKSIAAVIG
ncbi:hypothetical protein BJ912DRAFT_971404 [Pholiota molesta]|nr:hypothetical protein BJ912DRAFT_971404 [Pholiota molesta]